jgi:Zn-dependent membrane protease YugP
MLNASGLIAKDEEKGVRKVLNAAAMTYVAAAVGAILQLLRLILISRSRSRD